MTQQLSLFSSHPERPFNYPFPSTRYQGSKRALVNWIWDNVGHLTFNSMLDVFGGTGAVIARFALCQACIIKRPYNLFHRANLYIRTANVERSFGNKITWDTPFEAHFRKFVTEANRAIFDNHHANRAIQTDAFMTPIGADLVYIDPPYLNQHGIGVDYRDFYHFLEGMMNYDSWYTQIDYASKHRRLTPQESEWTQPKTILSAFEKLIARHQNSILVISYRDDGIPSKADLIALLKSYKSDVHEAQKSQQYVLSHKKSHEMLLIGL
ncbi:MAG: hypothetical protein CUN52_10605 [Phototrophicales bacterium]|nr:MAG: hypothetical protein CUN52_10605 [Phototrophicales bacterium]